MAEVPVTDEHRLAQCLSSLVAVVMAVITEDGRLQQANRGLRRILNVADDMLPETMDVRRFFIQPSFQQLLSMQAEAGNPVYEGILNIGDINAQCHSLIGQVHRSGSQLLVIGEYDVADMERLNAQVIELNEKLAFAQRNLARANRKLQASEAQLINMSLTDPLTGLANRRRLMEFLQNELERNRRYQEPFSVIMADIDFFKKVNDSFGHDMGDKVLTGFASLMKDSIRSVDLVARLGGEEFIIVMQNTSLEEATAKAEKLRAKTEQLDFDGMPHGITASFGVADFLGSSDVSTLLKHVDEAVYASKHGGRNRVSIYTAETSQHGATEGKPELA